MVTVLSEYFKSSERTIYWNEDLKRNVDPFEGLEGGFFATDWDFKVCGMSLAYPTQYSHKTLKFGNSAQNPSPVGRTAVMPQYRHKEYYRSRVGRVTK